MRLILVISALLFTTSAFAQAGGDPCQLAGMAGAPIMSFMNPSIGDRISDANILLGLSLSKERRLKVVCELKSAIMEKYSLIDLKVERIGVNADKHMQQCALDELAIASGDRQEFFDRVQKCIAGFQDTHFGGNTRVKRPVVLTAIQIVEVGGKIVISKQSPLLVARIKAENEAAWRGIEETLAVGNEITMIDGVQAVQAVAALEPYIDASTPGFAKMYAPMTFFQRGFLYPNKKTVSLEIRTARGELKHIELPWMAQLTPGNMDAQIRFKALGLPLVTELQWKFDPVRQKMEKSDEQLFPTGFNIRAPLFAKQSTLTTYLDDSGAPGLRTAEVILDRNQVFCYMQLLTFYSKNLVKETEKDAKEKPDFFAPIKAFVKSCEQKKLPLILDLKMNGGGNGSYPAKLLAILSEPGKTYPSDVAAFRITPSTVDLATADLDPTKMTGARDLDRGPDQVTMVAAISDAIQKGEKYTDVFNGPDVITDKEVGGFSQKLVTIVTPFCISACDMTARLLKTAKRGTIIGTHTNGTGAGFWSADVGSLDSSFTDTEGLLSFRIPNFLFGVSAGVNLPTRLPFASAKAQLLENIPTQADVQVPFTVEDVKTGGAAISRAALAELFKP